MSEAAGVLNGAFGRVALLNIDRPVRRHAHPQAHVPFKVGGADSWFRVGDRLLPLTERTAILVNSWAPHDYPHGALASKSLVLALYVEIEWLKQVDNSFSVSAETAFFPSPCVEVPRSLAVLLHDTADAAGNEVLSGTQDYLLAALMCEVINRFSDWRRLRLTTRSERSIARDFRIRRAIEFMRQHVNEPQAMDKVANSSALSRAHFFELFKSNTGISPLLFYHTLRMEASYRALLYGDDSLARIASQLHFRAPAHFTRFFRDHLGVTPSQFRHAARSHSTASQEVQRPTSNPARNTDARESVARRLAPR